jgi:hypothetical protein
MCGCKWGLLNVRKGNTKGAWWGAGGVWQQRRHAFLFQVLLKPTLTHGEGRLSRFSPNNELPKQFPARWGGLGHPWATYMSPKLFLLLACLRKEGGRDRWRERKMCDL